jgi:hypothetical protein
MGTEELLQRQYTERELLETSQDLGSTLQTAADTSEEDHRVYLRKLEARGETASEMLECATKVPVAQ